MKHILPEPINQNDAELIASYLRGELDMHERAAVEGRRKSDSSFNILFEAHIKLAAAARLSNLESKQKMLSEHARQNQVGQASSAPQAKRIVLGRRQWVTRLAAAGVLLLLVAVGVRTLIPQVHDRIFKAHFSHTIIPGDGELGPDTQTDSRNAFDYYNREDFSNAAREFDKLVSAQPEKDYLLYAALSHLGAGHLDRASDLLDQSLLRFPNSKAVIIQLKALVMVKRGDLDGAKGFLESDKTLFQDNRDLERLFLALQDTK